MKHSSCQTKRGKISPIALIKRKTEAEEKTGETNQSLKNAWWHWSLNPSTQKADGQEHL